jgi:hypothetical protein
MRTWGQREGLDRARIATTKEHNEFMAKLPVETQIIEKEEPRFYSGKFRSPQKKCVSQS